MSPSVQNRVLEEIKSNISAWTQKGRSIVTSFVGKFASSRKPAPTVNLDTLVDEEDKLIHLVLRSDWVPSDTLKKRKVGPTKIVQSLVSILNSWISTYGYVIKGLNLSKKLPESDLKRELLTQFNTRLKSYPQKIIIMGCMALLVGAAFWLYSMWSYLNTNQLKLDDVGKTAFGIAIAFLVALFIGLLGWIFKLNKQISTDRMTLWEYKEIIRLRTAIRKHSPGNSTDITPEQIQSYKEFLRRKLDAIQEDPEKITPHHAISYVESWEPERLRKTMEKGEYASQHLILWRRWPHIWGFLSDSKDLKRTFFRDLIDSIREGVIQNVHDDQHYCSLMESPSEWARFLDKAKIASKRQGHPQPKGFDHMVYTLLSTASSDGLERTDALLHHLGLTRGEAERHPKRIFQKLR